MQKNNLIKSSIIFIISFTLLLIIRNTISNSAQVVMIKTTQSILDKTVNEVYIFEKTTTVRNIEIDMIEVDCVYYKKGSDALLKKITIDIFTEFVLPIILIFSLSIAFPISFKKRLLFSFLALTLGIFVFYSKILVMIFDNYSNPNYVLIDFSFPLYQLVYFINLLLSTTGTSINLIIAVAIVAIAMIPFYKHIEDK